ncbi:ornithine carbamoyltransferase [Virgibacillus sp. W0430]|uniref:ornithine carbamoyltransferase n=1 Tax=Virgibacillus sp. W0430 TaxID=3391580 RepID=UPI003F4463C8
MINPVVVQHMRSKLEGKHFLKLADFTKAELMDLIRYTIQLKNMQKMGEPHPLLKGKTLAMIFEKSSTRTRVSFETGMYQLGGQALFLNKNDLQIGNGETIADTAKVLSRYVDGIMIRTYEHAIVEELAVNASIPIINGLTDDFHPCQVLADLVTIYEKKESFDDLKLAFVGDGNNMAQSLLMGCAIMGIDCTIASPDNSQVKQEIFSQVLEKAAVSGAKVEQTNDPVEAVANADIIYTDVWASMGWNGDLEERKKGFMKYQVNDALVTGAKDDYVFLHCLPAHREEEVASSIIDGDHSVVFDQAENRLHAQKAILASLL